MKTVPPVSRASSKMTLPTIFSQMVTAAPTARGETRLQVVG